MYSNQGHPTGGDYEKFLQGLINAINGEYSAIQCYEKMAKNAPTEKKRAQILKIREDEIKHYHQFSQIYMSLTGEKPSPKITEECPDKFEKALLAAFEDEQATTAFYLEMGDLNIQPSIRRLFRRTAADEQNHAVWFLSYLTTYAGRTNYIIDDKWHI